MRIDKFLSNAKIATRSEARRLIKDKRILLNGNYIKTSSQIIDENIDKITFDGNLILYKEFYYLVLNKPAGYLSATEDNYQKTVMELIEDYAKFNLAPVGRLDIDTTGLLLMSNDGALAHKLISPKYHVDKTYFVEVNHVLDPKLIADFAQGVKLDDGYITLPAKLKILTNKSAELTIHEGKFHQVKRMFKGFGYEVISLKRLSLGPLTLKGTKEGEFYILNEEEISQLKNL